MEDFLEPLLKCAADWSLAGDDEKAALDEHGALPALRQIALKKGQPPTLTAAAIQWCVNTALSKIDAQSRAVSPG